MPTAATIASSPTWLRRGLANSLVVCALVGAADSSAQTATPLERFEPAPAGDTFAAIPSAEIEGELRPVASLVLSYARSPLVLVDSRLNEPEVGDVVDHQLTLHGLVGVELFGRLKLELDLPATLDQGGESPQTGGFTTTSPSGFALNDIRAGARVVLLRQHRGLPAVSAALSAWFPSGDDQSYTSSGKVRVAPSIVIGADYGDFVWSSTVGRRFDTSADDSLLGHELMFGVAAGARIGPVLVSAEAWATTVSQRGTAAFADGTTNAEALLAVTYALGPFSFRLGGGPGLDNGPGTPDFRVIGMVGYAPEVTRNDSEQQEDYSSSRTPDDQLGSGLLASREVPASTGSDRDRDGVADGDDACPDSPGPRTGPKPGCPPDSDGDKVPNRDDACPDVAGVRSHDPKRDGCPPDSDGDGIIDPKDACPKAKGETNPDPKKNGCPESVRIVGEQIVILEQVQFETGRADLKTESSSVLQQVADVLKQTPTIVRLAIEGHTDNVGREARNIQLSQRRALAVMRWLIEHGVDERRLEARGYGPRQPVTKNDTAAGRAKNRRVDFQILERNRRGAAAWSDGGVE